VAQKLKPTAAGKMRYADNADVIDAAYDTALEENGEVLLSDLGGVTMSDLDFFKRYQTVGYPDGPEPQRVIRLR